VKFLKTKKHEYLNNSMNRIKSKSYEKIGSRKVSQLTNRKEKKHSLRVCDKEGNVHAC